MAGLHAALWNIGHVIENQGVRHNKKLVCVAILAGNPQLSQYKQYYFYRIVHIVLLYIQLLHQLQSRCILRIRLNFYPNNVPDFLAHAPPHPNVVPLLTAEQTREHKQALDQSYNQSVQGKIMFRSRL